MNRLSSCLLWVAPLVGCGARSTLDQNPWLASDAGGAVGAPSVASSSVASSSGGAHTSAVYTGGAPGAGGVHTGGRAASGGALSAGGAHSGGAWNLGGARTGGAASTGGARNGGSATSGGVSTGGASSVSTSSVGGNHIGGIPNTGGHSTTSADSLGGANTGGAATQATSGTGGVSTGGTFDGGVSSMGGDSGVSDPHLDPAGDATDARGDLLEAHVYLTNTVLEAQLRFASLPIPPNLSLRIIVASASDGFEFWLARSDTELLVRSFARNATLSYETCSSAKIDVVNGWLTVTLPALVLPDPQLTTFDVESEYAFNQSDKMDSGPLPVEPGPGPERDADAVCEPSPRVRRSTVRFKEVSLGWDFGCGLDLTGAALCWGTDAAMAWVGAVPSGAFEQIAVANQWVTEGVYACGRRSTGAVECWGDRPPIIRESYQYIGEPFGCGIKLSGGADCITSTGGGVGWSSLSLLGEHYVDAIGFAETNCVLSNAGPLYCWNPKKPVGDDFIAMELGSESDACALHKNGALACGEGHLPPLVLEQFDSPYPTGNMHFGCGIQPGGTPICWGAAGLVIPVAPGPFKRIEVSTSGEGVCGFKEDDTLECWQYGYVGADPIPATTPP